MNKKQKQQLVDSYDGWFHTIDFGDGVKSPGSSGDQSIGCSWQRKIDEFISDDYIINKDVLDVGSWDGAVSFYVEEKGAKSVTAMDQQYMRDETLPDRGYGQGFEIAKKIKNSKVIPVGASILNPGDVGPFDTILFFGVLYHLACPYQSLVILRKLLRPGGDLFIETTSSAALEEIKLPVLEFNPLRDPDHIVRQKTNFFNANTLALTTMLQDANFKVNKHYIKHGRLHVHATK